MAPLLAAVVDAAALSPPFAGRPFSFFGRRRDGGGGAAGGFVGTKKGKKPSSSDSSSRRISTPGAFVTFFKSLFGAGLLALPNVLGMVGLPLGIILSTFVAAGCAFSCHVLLRARELTELRLQAETENEMEMEMEGRRSYRHGPSGEEFFAPPRGGGGGSSGSSKVDVYDDDREDSGDAVACEDDACGGGGGGGGSHHRRNKKAGRGRGRVRGRPKHHLVTYGDLADAILGPIMASITRWTIISLNVLFTAGLVIVICENMSPLLGWEDEDELEARRFISLCLLPVVAVLLQIPWLQDMCFISALGLIVYTVGVIGSTLYSAIGTMREVREGGGATFGRGIPQDLWSFKYEGIPTFVGSAVYALEGISLALPTSHSMLHPSDADAVVSGGVLLYGLVTIVFASMGYAGGLGGGDGTGYSPEECDVVTNCITPVGLQRVIRYALSVAMILGIPVMLYPATEMLEVMLTDRRGEREEVEERRRREGGNERSGGWTEVEKEVSMVEFSDRERVSSRTNLADSPGGGGENNKYADYGVHGTSYVQHDADDDNDNDYFADDDDMDADRNNRHPGTSQDGYSQQKSWSLRLFLSVLVVTLGSAAARSFTLFSGLVGAVGLTFAGFVLPPLLYIRAAERADRVVGPTMKLTLGLLAGFGVCNMVVGGVGTMVQLVDGLSSEGSSF